MPDRRAACATIFPPASNSAARRSRPEASRRWAEPHGPPPTSTIRIRTSPVLAWGPNGAFSHARTDTVAAYAFDTVHFDERWQANAGVRFDRYRTELDGMIVCSTTRAPFCGSLPTGSLVANDGRSRDTLFSWNVGVLYKPAPNGSVYANYATSQQPPAVRRWN